VGKKDACLVMMYKIAWGKIAIIKKRDLSHP
jgi:hypothetical protein